MARYAVIADLAAQVNWERLAEAASKDDIRSSSDELIDAAALRAAVSTPPAEGSAMAQVLARLERALEDGCAMVDACLKSRYPDYSQPERDPDDPPSPVTVWTVDLALERLMGEGEGSEWRHRGDLARAKLEAIAEGELDLFGDVDGDGEDDDDGDSGALFSAPAAIFTRKSLAGFVGR